MLTSPSWPTQKLTYMKFVLSRFLFRPFSPRANKPISPTPLLSRCEDAMEVRIRIIGVHRYLLRGRSKDRLFYLLVVFHIRCYDRGTSIWWDRSDHLIRLRQHQSDGQTDTQTDGRTDREHHLENPHIETQPKQVKSESSTVWHLLYFQVGILWDLVEDEGI